MKTPLQDKASMVAFYGPVGENMTQVVLPFPMRLAWDTGTIVHKVTCHTKCADAFKAIWQSTLDHYGIDEIKRLKLDLFGGCLNVRKMRGGTSWSIHSWGAAWDVNPDENQLKWGKDKASLAKKDYDPFWKIVETNGGISLGRLKNYDWMHFQFARFR